MSHGLLSFEVVHTRVTPLKYKFTHKLFWFKIDLNNLNNLPTPFVSNNRFNLYSFFDKDHISVGKNTAKENYIEIARKHGVVSEIVDVHLYTQLRFLGYVFNPVSFILMTDVNGLKYAVIEIGNTFNEIKSYFVNDKHFSKNGFTFSTKKYFYISPFTEHDNVMAFRFRQDEGNIAIVVDDKKEEEKILKISFRGSEMEATTRNLLIQSLYSPFVTLKIIFLIHWHAFILWFKGLPYYKKQENKHLQKGAQVWKT
jgi:DUF1365 family protein